MSDLVVNVKQIGSYPNLPASNGTETLLVQTQGLGGPYQSIGAAALVSTAVAQASMGVGSGIPGTASAGQLFTNEVVVPLDGAYWWNAYYDASQTPRYWAAGAAAIAEFDQSQGYLWSMAQPGSPGQPVTFSELMRLGVAGNLNLPFGTITVARDPAAPMEVATLNWISNNTVASFNNRIGSVQLTASDVYSALGYVDYIATQPWVINAINGAIGNFITSYPLVTTFNARTGDIWLTLSDITCTFFQPGQQPISPTPIATSNDNSIATTQWVTTFVTDELTGGGQNLASQSWVLANTVNSFNNRLGQVTLTAADVFDVGAAPLNSPNFSGIPNAPTANPGTSTSQLATTAFVHAAVTAGTAGVASFNTRTGAVVLTGADITSAGGALLASPVFTGTPTAPTPTAGNASTNIATTAFVANAIAAIGTGVTSFNTRTGAITLQLTDITGAGGAPNASPNLSGTPTAPTANAGTSTTQIATTAFVAAALTAQGGVSSFNSRTGAVTLTNNDITAAGGLANPSVNLTGSPTATTPAPGANNTQIATTAYVASAISTGAVQSFNTRTGAVTLVAADISGAGGALLASPALTGVPTAPTAAPATNTTQLATCAYVQAAVTAGSAGVSSFNTRTGAVTLNSADITGAGGALLASPALTGTPSAPTATVGTSTTQIATTAFVQAALGSTGVSSFNSRTGAVTLQANDLTAAGGALLASPTFTGTPAAPTATAGTSTTQLASTQFVTTAIGALAIPGVATTTPIMDGTAAIGTLATYARADHIHPSDTSRAPLASPTFTGTPAAPTAATNTNTTQLATTAYVVGQAGTQSPNMDGTAATGTSLLYARQDHVHPTDTSRAPLASPTFTGTVTIPAGASISGYAPLASPTFTGTPAAPTVAATAAAGTTQLATTAFVRNGTTTNDSALAGQVGEYMVATAASVAATTATFVNITSIALTAGDWDVWGSMVGTAAGATITNQGVSVGTTSGNANPDWTYGDGMFFIQGSNSSPLQSGVKRVSVATTTTCYVTGQLTFTGGAPTMAGKIQARRVR